MAYKLTYKQYYPEGFEVRKSRPRRELVYGVGNNDAPYATQPYLKIKSKRPKCPAYRKWQSVLQRAYCPEYQARQPTYIGTEVCKDWLDSFMTFRAWFFAELSKTNLTPREAEVDKDCLTDKKLYSPKTCILIPDSLNNLLTDRGAARGGLPQGVTQSGSRYVSRVRTPKVKGSEYLGTFKTVAEAFDAYIKRKTDVIKSAPIPYWLDEDKIRRRLLTIFRRQMRAQRIEFAHLL